MSEQTLNNAMHEDAPGFYGKIPSLGDFVTRRLPRGFIAPWETWMQEAIANSREQLGDFWLDNYLTSPLWRFALTPGICGEHGWAGVLMPSVDRVGRYYPFTMAARLDPKCNLFLFMEESEAWFARMESLALSCLEDDFQMESFEQQLHAVGLPDSERETHSAQPEAATTALSNAWHANLDDQSSMRTIYPLFLPHLMKKLLFAYSLWWTQGSERISPSLLLCQGLPQIKGASALIDGAWAQHGWEEIETGTYAMGAASDIEASQPQ
ncbi:MAG: type VI secretion system-associated protein TagF [Candidatus Thiodiazotropha endolucinida]